MANANDIKRRMRSHIEARLHEVRDLPGTGSYYRDVAYGAIWAANYADVITDQERDAYLDELRATERMAA